MQATVLNPTDRFSFNHPGRQQKWLARWVTTCLIAFACCWIIPAANAQQGLGIAAIVNDDIVSIFDLEARLSLILASSGLPNTPDSRQRLAGQVLRGLIDEKLKHQEAKRLGIQVTKRDVDRALGYIAIQNKIPLSQLDAFLASKGIHKPTLIEKLEADVAWIKVVNRSLRATIDIDAKAVDRLIGRLEAEKGQIENHVSEIFLPVDDTAQDAQVRETAERMVEQIHSGASFNALAQSFSQSASAAITGDLGWLKQGDLDEELEAVVNQLQPGQTSAPIRSVSGYHVLHLQERQRAAGLPISEITVDLQQLFFALPPNASAAEINETAEYCGLDRGGNQEPDGPCRDHGRRRQFLRGHGAARQGAGQRSFRWHEGCENQCAGARASRCRRAAGAAEGRCPGKNRGWGYSVDGLRASWRRPERRTTQRGQ